MNSSKAAFIKGFKDSLPVCIGYFAVSIAVGLNAVEAGLSPFQATLMSFTNLTSAGQAVAINIIAEKGSYAEILISQLVINLRYLLMGAALSIKLKEETSVPVRLLFSYGITDEVFGLSENQKSPLCAWYTIGAWMMAVPGWVLGTLFGSVLGNILPTILVDSFSLGLYAMFIAIILPKAKEDVTIALIVVLSMIASYFFAKAIPSISSGNRIIILTILISVIAAIIKPLKDEEDENNEENKDDYADFPEADK